MLLLNKKMHILIAFGKEKIIPKLSALPSKFFNFITFLSSEFKIIFLSSYLLDFDSKNKPLLKLIRILELIFTVFGTLLIILNFEFLIDLFKTVGNLNNLSDTYYTRKIYIFISVSLLVLFVFIKSIIYGCICFFLKYKYQISLINNFKFVSIFCFIYFLSLIIFGEYSIRSALNDRQEDISIVKTIVNNPKIKHTVTYVYVDKIPELYRRAGFNISSKIVFFDSLFADNKNKLIFADPNDEHLILLNNEYKFSKLSPTLSLYVKDKSILDSLVSSGYKFSSAYTYDKKLNLKRIANINKLKFDSKKGIQLCNERKSIHKIDSIYLSKGTYKFYINLESKKNEYIQENDNSPLVGKVRLTANNGAIILEEQNLKLSDFKNSYINLEIKKVLETNLHSFNIEIIVYNYKVYVNNIGISKE